MSSVISDYMYTKVLQDISISVHFVYFFQL